MSIEKRHKKLGISGTTFSRKSGAGYTLIEALVVIGIIGLISAIVFVDSRKGNQSLSLDRAAHAVAQDVRATNERVLKGEVFTSCPGAGLITGYGMFFDESKPTEYIVFANCDLNDVYDGPLVDGLIETIFLEDKINIFSLTPANPLHIMFIPPDPTVKINGIGGTGIFAQIVLNSAGGLQKTININERGAIDID